MRYQTQEKYPIAVVALHDGPDDHPLADVLHERLAEQPAALVLDLSELCDPGAALPFVRAVVRAARLPGSAPVIVVAPGVPDAAPDVVADRESALAIAEDQPTPHRHILINLPPDPHVLRRIRRAVAEACLEWGIPEVVSSAQLVASELLSNTVEHTGTPADVTIAERDGHLHIVVRDGSHALPEQPHHARPNDARGRGLLLIEELSVGLVAVSTEAGKLVWAVVPVQPPGMHAGRLSLARNRR